MSNSEIGVRPGGVGAIEFGANGAIVDAYSILSGTSRQLRGRADAVGDLALVRGDRAPGGSSSAIRSRRIRRESCGPRSARSTTRPPPSPHAAQRVYLTEDRTDGLLYRFTPRAIRASPRARSRRRRSSTRRRARSSRARCGRRVARGAEPESRPAARPPRATRCRATPFNGGEGCWYRGGLVRSRPRATTASGSSTRRRHDRDPLRPRDRGQSVLSDVDNVYTIAVWRRLRGRGRRQSRDRRADAGRARAADRAPGGRRGHRDHRAGALARRQPALLQLAAQPGQDVRGVGAVRRAGAIPSLGGAWALLLLGALGAAALRALATRRDPRARSAEHSATQP